MAAPLTDEERRQAIAYLERESAARRQSALSSQKSFFSWLKNVGLGALVVKLAEVAWSAIKAFFGF